MIIENGTQYANNFARAAAYFLGTCAPEPTKEDEKAAYNFVTGMYKAIIADAESMCFKPQPDVTFIPWEKQKGREADVKLIRGAIDKVEAMIKELFELADCAELFDDGFLLPVGFKKPKKPLLNGFAAVGCLYEHGEQPKLKLPGSTASGLKKLCAISKEHIIKITDCAKEDKAHLYFSRCVFDQSDNWVAKAYDKYLRADGCLLLLCEELEKRGYTRIDCRDGKKISLDYVKQHGEKQEPLKWAWGEKTHSGIEITYEEIVNTPCYLWLRMPMYKRVLENIDKLPENVAEFLIDCTKTCDGCRYCVQTDKTGKRPLAAFSIGGKKKCPLYPGFTMNWRSLNENTAKNILNALDAIDALPELN